MIGFFDAIKIGAGAVLGGVVALAFTHLVIVPAARAEAVQQARAATLEKAIDLVHEKSRTNADVQKLDDADICRELGGVWDDGVCG